MDEDIQQLERDLEAAKRRLEAASAALAPVHKGGEEEEWQAALYACLEIERKLALSKGEEAAMPCEWEIPWDTGAPCPHVLASGRRTILIYLADTFDPDWDGSFVSVIDPKASDPQPLVIVEFAGCYIHKFGGPNDEVFGGLPWEGRGLKRLRSVRHQELVMACRDESSEQRSPLLLGIDLLPVETLRASVPR